MKNNTTFIDLDLTMDSFVVKEFVQDVINISGLTKRLDLAEEALACILASLYVNHLSGSTTMIRGDWAYWNNKHIKKTYAWARIKRINALLDAMVKMRYINKVAGVHNKQNKYVAKYWFKDNAPILDTLDKLDRSPVYVKDFSSPVVVRDKNGASLNWEDLKCNKKEIKKMGANINKYNRLISKQEITFELTIAEIYNAKGDWFNTINNFSHYVNVNSIELYIDSNIIKNMYIYKDSLVLNSIDSSYLLDKEDNLSERSDILYGIIKYTTQRRIFNRGSFEFGGRFTGGSWNNLSKVVRDKFRINGEAVERLDYDGIHLRMLYHNIGIDFTGEAYVYSKEENNVDRERMKLITLIMVNAKSSREGVYVINKKFKKKGLFVSEYYTKKLIKKFKEYHSPISSYFFSDVGVALQKVDSDIMHNVLTRLTKEGVAILSLHDEAIFSTRHKDLVEETMLNAYYKEIGFKTTVV